MSAKKPIDPARLQILVDLRKAVRPRLSQSTVAEKFGLGRTGDRTVGEWENGRSIPKESQRRSRFIGYLWDDLGLRREPEKFVEIWEMLVEVWRWEPLDEEEWKGFTNQPKPGRAHRHPSLSTVDPKRPPDVSHFIGRKDELAYFADQLEKFNFVAITGAAGIGKTATMARLAQLHGTTELICWHQSYAHHDVMSLVWDLAGFLAWRGEESIWITLNRGTETGGLPSSGILIDALFKLLEGDDYLLCIDNFQHINEDKAQKELVDKIISAAGAGNFKLIVTAQQSLLLGKERFKPLQGLTLDDTRTLVQTKRQKRLHDRPITDEQIALLHSSIEGNAKLLLLAVAQIEELQSADNLIRQLVQQEDIAQFLKTEIKNSLDGVERGIMNSISALLDYPGTPDLIDEMANGIDDLVDHLTSLVNRFLLESELSAEKTITRYRQHLIVQEHFYISLGRQQRLQLHLRAAQYYEAVEKELFLAAIHYHHAEEYSNAAKLATADPLALIYRGESKRLRLLLESVYKTELEPEEDAAIQITLGDIATFWSEQKSATEAYDNAFRKLQPLPESVSTRALLVRVCRGMAMVLRYHNPQVAEEWINKGLGHALPSDILGQADLQTLMSTAQLSTNIPKAKETCEKALGLLQNLPNSAKAAYLKRLAQLNLGNAYYYQNDFKAAEGLWQQALQLATENNEGFSKLSIHINLAMLYQTTGQWTQAKAQYETAFGMANDFGNAPEIARVMIASGILHLKQNDETTAQTRLTQGTELARSLKENDLTIMGLAYLAELALRQKNESKMNSLLEEAEQLSHSFNITMQLTTIYRIWAQYYLEEQNPQMAMEWATRAVESARKDGYEVESGAALRVLASAYESIEDHEAARKHFQLSLTATTDSLYETACTQLAYSQFLHQMDEQSDAEYYLTEAERNFETLELKYQGV